MSVETINPVAAERNEAVKSWMDDAGFARMPDIFAPGTMLYEGGNAYRAKRQEVEAMDDVGAGVEKFIAQIKSEKREDYAIDLKSPRMIENLLSTDHGVLGMEESAFRKLAGMIAPPGGVQYLAACPPNVRAFNYNFWSGHPVNADETALLRTRNGATPRKVWAAVSQSYGKFDVDEIAGIIRDEARGGAKFSVIYDGKRAQFDVVYVTPIEDDRLVGTGELFKMGFRITTADDGTERARVYSTIWRGMCRNFGIIDESDVEVGQTVHRGDSKSMHSKIGVLIGASQHKLSKYLDAWVEAGQDKILGDSEVTVQTRLSRLVEKGYVKVAGTDKDTMYRRLLRAWEKEPGYTRQHLVNAITRSAHENSWASPWTTQEVELLGSRLVYVKNLQLA